MKLVFIALMDSESRYLCICVCCLYGPHHEKPVCEILQLFSCSTQLIDVKIPTIVDILIFMSMINVRMQTIVGILIFMSMINTTAVPLKARKDFIIFNYFRFYEHLESHAQLS